MTKREKKQLKVFQVNVLLKIKLLLQLCTLVSTLPNKKGGDF